MTEENDHILTDPLSEVTRRERKYLLGLSLLTFFITNAGIVPKKIPALGIEFSLTDQKYLLFILLLVVAYFLVTFWIYVWSDWLAWDRQRTNQWYEIVKDGLILKDDELLFKNIKEKMTQAIKDISNIQSATGSVSIINSSEDSVRKELIDITNEIDTIHNQALKVELKNKMIKLDNMLRDVSQQRRKGTKPQGLASLISSSSTSIDLTFDNVKHEIVSAKIKNNKMRWLRFSNHRILYEIIIPSLIAVTAIIMLVLYEEPTKLYHNSFFTPTYYFFENPFDVSNYKDSINTS